VYEFQCSSGLLRLLLHYRGCSYNDASAGGAVRQKWLKGIACSGDWQAPGGVFSGFGGNSYIIGSVAASECHPIEATWSHTFPSTTAAGILLRTMFGPSSTWTLTT
jgi:hypothetical protein